ncbi:HXXXD-type acyl-transferase family protein [Perilla frutescens var. hirtella]|nr:HXXXD-type acyl-transferase family protein [Perilla frutescens var. hirtella]
MEFCVSRVSEGLVAPSGPTPSGLLELSVVDRLPVLRCNARTLHVFKHGPGPETTAALLIREALAKALIPYYPLAGRLHVSSDEELQIACTGDGIWVVDASADCTLDDLHYFDDAMSIPYENLLPPPPPPQTHLHPPLVQMQVTQFQCNGFVIGLIFCHAICDGLGAAQFLNAVGDMARGAETPAVGPHWCRNFLPTATPSPSPSFPLAIPVPDYQLEPAIIDISLEEIEKLKQEFRRGRPGERCSTFEVVAAMLWRRRTEVIGLDEDTEVKLVFFANCRTLVEPALPEGFYGNCFFPVSVSARSGELMAKDVMEVVEVIKEGKRRLPEEFRKWGERGGGEAFAPPLEYRTLFISEWGRLGFMEVDYGWGRPVHVVPVQGSSIIPVGIVCSQPRPRTGVRLMTWCVSKPHLPPLLHHFKS